MALIASQMVVQLWWPSIVGVAASGARNLGIPCLRALLAKLWWLDFASNAFGDLVSEVQIC